MHKEKENVREEEYVPPLQPKGKSSLNARLQMIKIRSNNQDTSSLLRLDDFLNGGGLMDSSADMKSRPTRARPMIRGK